MTILDKNQWGTLESIDAVSRFRFLLKDNDFISYLKSFQSELNEFTEDQNTWLKLSYHQAFEEIKLLRVHFIKICSDLHMNLGLSFDYSYTFIKGKSWERTHNIFNMNSKILEKLESRRRQGSIQQRLQEVEVKDPGLIKSDILPQIEEVKENIKKTVHIELIDVDMNESNEASQSRNKDTEEKPDIESSDTSGSQPVKEKIIIDNTQLDLEDRENKFKIK